MRVLCRKARATHGLRTGYARATHAHRTLHRILRPTYVPPASHTVDNRQKAVPFYLIAIALTGLSASRLPRAVRNTVVTLSNAEELVAAGLRVCSYPTSFNSGQVLSAVASSKAVFGATMAECGERLRAGEADAAVMDAPIARHWKSQTPWANALSISPNLQRYNVAIIAPENGGAAGDAYVRQLVPAILEYAESPAYAAAFAKWFPASASVHGTEDEAIRWDLMIPTLALMGIYAALQLFLVCRGARTSMHNGRIKPEELPPHKPAMQPVHTPSEPAMQPMQRLMLSTPVVAAPTRARAARVPMACCRAEEAQTGLSYHRQPLPGIL